MIRKYWPLVLLLILWEFALGWQECREGPRYFEVILVTATVCVAFWIADVNKDTLVNWRRVPRVLVLALYELVVFLVLFVVIAIPVAIVTPHYSCYTPRAKMSEVILYAASFRASIQERAEKTGSLRNSGAGLSVESSKRVAGGVISPDGVIVVVSEDPPGVVVLRPRMEGGVVKWTCGGVPVENFPGSCREPPF